MKYNQLDISARKKITRAGRGIAAGRGKTAGRGTKGQKARTGGNIKPGFEGGQNSLIMRLPKLRGFKSHRTPTQNVYTGQLEKLKVKKVDNFVLADNKLIADPYSAVKLIVKGELTKAIDLETQSASESAVEALQSAGGSFTRVERPKREKTSEK